MHVARHVGKCGHNPGMKRVAHVKDKSPAGIMIVGKEHPALGHRVFGVVHAHGPLLGDDRRDELPVRRRSRVCVNHREEIVALFRRVTGPDKQTVLRRPRFLRLNRYENIYGIDCLLYTSRCV